MTKIILDPHWRTIDELFSSHAQKELKKFDVVWGKDEPIPENVLKDALPTADILVAASPNVGRETLEDAPNLKAIIEVSGAFPDSIDYAACAERGVEVLSCAPGFRTAVAEMGLAMTLSAARGLVREHESFRNGTERWLMDCAETDFTLFGANVGFVGFGQIAQEMTRLLAPFGVRVSAFDPWLPKKVSKDFGVYLQELDDLAAASKVLFVTAVPTADNKAMINRQVLSNMQDHSVLVLLSRAHLVDFDALTAEAQSGRLTIVTDVFPEEPLAANHPIRNLPNVILSPHRAAAVAGGRHLIGDLVLSDINAIRDGSCNRQLQKADLQKMASLAGVGDAHKVADIAAKRP